jgi:outer membrane protein assembly factor BamA
VENEYRGLGYNDARASVATAIDREHGRVDVALAVTEGRQAILAGVEVAGADVTTRGTIEGALGLPIGSPVGLDKVYRAQKGLYDTGVFQHAEVALSPVDQTATASISGVQAVRAGVTVRELPPYQFRYGFRLTDEVGPVEATRQVRSAFVADLLRKNLFGRAISTGVAGQIEKDRGLLRGLLSLPKLFTLPVVTNVFASTSREVFPPVTEFDTTLVERVTEFTVEQRFRPARDMGVSYGYDLERKRTFDPEPDPDSVLPPLDLVAKVARLTAAYAWDTRDDPSDARRGWFHSSGVEYGAKALGSDLQFVKYLAQQSYFLGALRERVVLASSFRLGLGRPFEGQRLDQKFLAGGGTSVRGFAEDSLGGVDFFGPIGGDALLVLNQEVRFPIVWWFRGVAFIDAGNVFATPSEVSFRNLDVGTGLGLRVHSPFALLRLDFGLPVTRRNEELPHRWYFGIGHVF